MFNEIFSWHSHITVVWECGMPIPLYVLLLISQVGNKGRAAWQPGGFPQARQVFGRSELWCAEIKPVLIWT